MQSSSQVDEFVTASGGVQVTHQDDTLLRRYSALHDATYCRPGCDTCEAACPEQVQIADVLRHKMYFADYGTERLAMEGYTTLTHNAAACVTCAHQRCLHACPYGLAIPELTRQAHRLLHWPTT
jgi:predicted aldo/keto reductase-like oxidoreductase